MPTTAEGFRYPASTDDVQLWTKFQALAEDIDTYVNLPARVETPVAAVIGLAGVAGTWGPLATAVTAVITNPSAVYDLHVDVQISALVLVGSGTGNVQLGIAASGGMTITPASPGGGGAIAAGENFLISATVAGSSCQIMSPITIPAGAAATTFAMWGMRTVADGVKNISNPAIRIIPRRFNKP